MYNNEYEDYMRSVLGYPNPYSNSNRYDNNYIYNSNSSYFPYRSNNMPDINLDSMYPEIYRILQPMIIKKCTDINYRDLSEAMIESMVNDIYSNVETNENINTVNINITTTQEAETIYNNNIKSSSKEKCPFNADRNIAKDNSKDTKNEKEKQEAESRNFNKNNTLRDLIRILLLNQIINNNPNRPPFSPRPPRPPYRELENPAIYHPEYSMCDSYHFFN